MKIFSFWAILLSCISITALAAEGLQASVKVSLVRGKVVSNASLLLRSQGGRTHLEGLSGKALPAGSWLVHTGKAAYRVRGRTGRLVGQGEFFPFPVTKREACQKVSTWVAEAPSEKIDNFLCEKYRLGSSLTCGGQRVERVQELWVTRLFGPGNLPKSWQESLISTGSTAADAGLRKKSGQLAARVLILRSIATETVTDQSGKSRTVVEVELSGLKSAALSEAFFQAPSTKPPKSGQ